MRKTTLQFAIVAALLGPALFAETLVGIVPVAGSTPGAFGARFRTTLQLANPTASPIRGSIAFHPQGFPASPRDPRIVFELAPRATHAWEDVVEEMGATGLGSLDIFVDEGAAPVAVARVFDDGEGTRGVTVPLMRPAEALHIGEAATLLVPADLERFRFNLGVRTLGEGARIRIDAYDADGALVHASEPLALPADFLDQRPGAAFLGADLPPNGSLVVHIEDGSAIVYGTTTDNRTNDPSFQIDRKMNKRPRLVETTVRPLPDGSAEIRICVADAEGDDVTLSVVEPPSTGTLGPAIDQGGGCFTLIYSGGAAAGATIELALTDAEGNVALVEVQIDLDGGNGAPVAEAQSVTVPEDGSRAITLTATDPDGDPVTFTLIAGPAHGTLTGTAPNVVYTPNANYHGADAFTFRASDGADSSTATVSIVVTPVNDVPAAGAVSVTTPEDTPVAVTLTGADVDGDPLLFFLLSSPANGTLSGAAPNLTYTPAPDFNGTDAFSYAVGDGAATSGTVAVSITVSPANDAPMATGASIATDEDTPVAIALTASDIDGDALTWTVGTPAHGTLSGMAPNLTYTPAADYAGSDAFVFSVTDGLLGSGTATVAITVNPVSDPPVAAADVYGTPQGSALTAPAPGVLANDSDPEGDALSAVLDAGPANGTLALSSDGSFTYTPNGGFAGTDTFTYHATDGTGSSAPVTVSINVSAANAAPVATSQAVATPEDTPLPVTLGGMDADGDALAFAVVTPPANGALMGTAPNLTYVPNADFNGPDSFRFTASDGIATSTPATVTITVTPANDAPVAAADVYGTTMATALVVAVPGVLGNDSDADGDTLLAVLETVPANGTLTLNLDGSFTYTPDASFAGIDGFDYRAGDGIVSSAPAHVTINVRTGNRAPSATGQTVTTTEDAAVGITLSGTDADGDTLAFAIDTPPADGTLSGTVPNLAYTPDADFNGTDSFTFTATDGIATSAPATVTVTVTAANDLPVAMDDAHATNEDAALNIAAPGVLANDTDVDGDALTAALVTAPANGTLALAADGSFDYTPDGDFFGDDAFFYRANDGAADSNVARVAVTVNAINDDPIAADDATTMDEDVAATAVDVLANDGSGPDAPETLTITGVTQGTSGTVAITGGGTGLTYQPAADFFGADTFTYTIGDGNGGSATASVTVTVNNLNDDPVATGDAATVDEDSGANAIDVLANDDDAPDAGETLTITAVTPGADGAVAITGGGTGLTYTPNANFFGSDTFTYTIGDGNGGTATATVNVTVANVNDDPVATGDAATVAEDSGANAIDVLANDNDGVDTGETLTITGVTQGAGGTVAITGGGTGLTYTPNANFFGADTFTYTIGDGNGGTATATVNVTVTNVNDDPTPAGDAATVAEDSGATAIDVLANDDDAPDTGETLTITAVTQGASGAVAITGGGTSLTYTPNADFFGADTFTYTISDGNGGTAAATVNVTVTNVNDDPIATDDAATVLEDSGANAVAVLANDSDGVDAGETLTIIGVTQGASGTVAITGGGTGVTYAPNANVFGADTFTYTISDGNGGTAVAAVTVTVTSVNDDPAAAADAATVVEDSAANAIGILANDTGAPDTGETLTITGVTQGTSGSVAITGGGTGLTYTPNANFFGGDTFTYTIADGNGGSDTATVTVTVTNTNDPPDAVDDGATVGEDGGATAIDVLANDTSLPDPPETLTITAVTQPANGTVTFTGTGVTFTPSANFNGITTFTYTIADGNGGNDTATVTMTVTSANDTPDAIDDAATVAEDSGATAIVVLANDSIAPDTGETLTISGVTQGANGAVVITGGGTGLTYQPNADFFGADGFTYTISDGNGGSDTATVTVTVTNVNDDPAAVDDAATVAEDSGATAIDVLANDTAAPDTGETLTITAVTQGANGTVVITGGGIGLTYQPDADFFGADTFTYTIGDGNGGTATATVTMTVPNTNDAPAFTSVAPTAATEDVAYAYGITTNDADPGDALTITAPTRPLWLTLTDNGDGTATLAGTPANAEVGDHTVELVVTDAALATDTQNFTITVTNVNDAPVVTGATFAIDENTANATNVGTPVTATDDEGDGITWAITGGNTGGAFAIGAASGQITVANSGALDYETTASFALTVTATDDGTPNQAGSATVTINLNNLNDTAPVANGDAYGLAEGATLNVAAPGVAGNDTDADGATAFAASLVAAPSRGALTFNTDGSFTYVHDGSHNAADSFTYSISDGVQSSGVATVSLTITLANDAPVAAGNSYAVAQGGTLTVAAPGVLGNDTDEEGNALAAVPDTSPASAASFTLNADGSFTYVHDGVGTTSDSFTYHANDGTSDSNTVTVTIAVIASNNAPVATGDSWSVSDGGTLTIAAPGVLANDTDAEGNALTTVLGTTAANGTLTLNANGSFTYVHTGGAGSDSFTYRAHDGQASSNLATVTITILGGANTAPAAVDDAYTIARGGTLTVPAAGVLANDSDADGNDLSASVVTTTTNGTLTLNPDGSFTYANSGSAATSDTFTYVANDGQDDSAAATVTITITATNAAPTADADGPYVTSQNRPLNVAAPGVLDGDADADGNPIHPVLVTAPADGTLTLNADGSFTYLPDLGFIGNDSFVYRASDGLDESLDATVTIDVLANAAPVAVADAYSTDEDVALNVAAAGVLGNDTDAETDALTAILVSGPSNASSFTLNADGSFSYTPNANFNGADSFTYKANDGQDSNVVTVSLTVDAVNDAPSFTGGGDVTVNEDSGAYSAGWASGMSAGPANESAQTLSFTAVLSATDSTLTFTSAPSVAVDGTLTFTPAADAYGSTTVTVTLKDSGGTANGGTDEASIAFTLTVTGINDAPVVTAGGALAYTENDAATAVDAAITVSDVDSTNLTGATVQITGNYASAEDVLAYTTALGITGTWNATTGTLTLAGTTTVANYQTALRNVTYANTSDDPSTLTRTVTWIADDGGAANNTSTAVTSTIAVTAENDPPTAAAAGPFAAYSAIPISFPAATLSGTDAEAGTTVTIDTTAGTVTNGTVSIATDGSFTFTPAAGVTGNGAASFEYRVCDDGNPGPGVCGAYTTVSFNVSGPAFHFVKAAAVGTGDCTLGNECTLATATANIGVAGGRTIFIDDAGTHNAAVALNASGALVGQGVTGASFDAFFAINAAAVTPGTLATRPAINQTAPTIQQTVTLGAGAAVRGVSISTTGVTAMTGGAVDAPVVTQVSINAGGAAALLLSGTTNASLSFSSLSSSGATNGVSLTNVTGTVGASAGTVTGGAGAAFLVSGGTVGGTWTTTFSQANSAPLVSITNHTLGTLAFSTVSATNGTGLQFTNADGTYTFTTATLGGGDAGVDIFGGIDGVNGSQGTFTFGASSSVTNPSGSLFNIQGSKPALTWPGSFSKTTSGIGINVANNTGGTIAFSGTSVTKTISTSGSAAVNLTSNTGAIIDFTGGGLAVTTTTGTGFNVSGGGTVTIQGTANTLTSGAGTALTIANTTIGGGGVTLQSVNSTTSGSNVTIALANTGAGAFSITGTGGAGSGGTISNKTADAITLSNTGGLVSLQSMTIEDIGNMSGSFHTISGHDAIHGENVNGGLSLASMTIRRISDCAVNGSTFAGGTATTFNGLTVSSSTIQFSNRYHVAGTGDANNEGMIRILGVRGTVSITNSTLEDGGELVDFFVTGGTLNMTATGSNFRRSYKEFTSGPTASVGNHCVDVTVSGGTANVNVGNTTGTFPINNFLNCRLGSVRVVNDTGSTGSISTVIARNNFVVNDHSSGIGGDFDFPMGGVLVWSLAAGATDARISGNYFDETTRASGGLGSVSVFADAGTLQSRIDANTFDNLGDGTWYLRARGGATSKARVDGNIYTAGTFVCPDTACAGGYPGNPLYQFAEAQDGATLHLTHSGETYTRHDDSFYPGNSLEIRLNNVGAAGNVCANLSNLGAPLGYALERFTGTATNFSLYRGASGFTGNCTTGQCQGVLQSNNVLGGGGVTTTSPPTLTMPNAINVVSTACQTPTGGIF
ncbi:MAG: beta strand repeat-containing protein [Thermoanaerobaculia bacterium]